MTKWIKWPAPGQFRGEGEWLRLENAPCSEAYWYDCHDTGYLPTHEGDQPPPEPVNERKGNA
jgi:hypothetical protein